ncbi:YitT family protein [Enterococcus sp. BWB1-3]|uniref:YitT family protein n=1 Tax=unclassified Enterococcus TaxID=2608891 RepID=UPI00192216D4|nr:MULTISPECIES: YitT family protein [unclassified Enterococcus]MBL1229334.1 YitT family protein [Enterococcus sp. BWB1-3]MCB5951261.1 YitT family protein [Enterococcus sp. BWT-B8]MCB5956125.1 YitT family protein [Enterococcus sp. CWB-B31]
MKDELKKIPGILAGIIIISIGLNFFLLPHGIASAGVGSIGYLLEILLLIDRTVIVWSVNLLMLCLAFLFLNRDVFLKTLLGSLMFPVILSYVPVVSVTRFFPVALIIGSFMFSLGIFILYQIGASNGGVTVPPLIFNRHFGMDRATGVFLTNLVIILLNFIVFGVREAVVSAISIYLIAIFMKKMMQIKETAAERKKDAIRDLSN